MDTAEAIFSESASFPVPIAHIGSYAKRPGDMLSLQKVCSCFSRKGFFLLFSRIYKPSPIQKIFDNPCSFNLKPFSKTIFSVSPFSLSSE